MYSCIDVQKVQSWSQNFDPHIGRFLITKETLVASNCIAIMFHEVSSASRINKNVSQGLGLWLLKKGAQTASDGPLTPLKADIYSKVTLVIVTGPFSVLQKQHHFLFLCSLWLVGDQALVGHLHPCNCQKFGTRDILREYRKAALWMLFCKYHRITCYFHLSFIH